MPALSSDYTFSSLAREVHAPPAKRGRGRPQRLRHKGADESRGGGTKRSMRMESRRRLISKSQGERVDVTSYKTGLAHDDIVNSGDEESVDPDDESDEASDVENSRVGAGVNPLPPPSSSPSPPPHPEPVAPPPPKTLIAPTLNFFFKKMGGG